MRAPNIVRACVCGLAIAAVATAETTVTHFVASGRAGDAYYWGNTSGYSVLVSETTERGPNGVAYAWLNFGSYLGAYPDLVNISGWGMVPASAVSGSAEFIAVDIADVLSIPGFFVQVLACVQGNCQWVQPTGPIPVKITFRVTKEFQEDTNGTTRRRVLNPDGSTWLYTQNGSSNRSSAVAQGNVAGVAVPISDPVWGYAQVLANRGVTITVARSPQ